MGSVILGSARIDENGHATGGKRGDQKQTESPDYHGEVSMQPYYNRSGGWYVLRPKSEQHAAVMAERMMTACNNAHIGYSQSDRTHLSTVGINTEVDSNCDCSSLVRQCIVEATGKKSLDFFCTSDEPSVLEGTGLFEKRFSCDSTEDSHKLRAGDVMVSKGKGHTVIVVSTNGQLPDGTFVPYDGSDSSDSSGGTVDPSQAYIKIKDKTDLSAGNSSLAGYINKTSDSNSTPRKVPISCITIHNAATVGSLDDIAKMIKKSKSSYNYAIDSEGTIGLFIGESYAANATGDADNDERSVNIICLNTALEPNYLISDQCYESLVDLCEDICRRRFIFTLAADYKHPEQATLTWHYQFDDSITRDTCPGKNIWARQLLLIKEVNERLNTVNRTRVSVTSFQADSETAALRAQSTVSLGAVYPYVARLAHDTVNIDYVSLANIGVVGVLAHGGAYFDAKHEVMDTPEDKHLAQQIKEATAAKLPFGIEYITRAQNIKEVRTEADKLYYILSRYKPKLGVWLRCQFTKGLKVAPEIVDKYYEYFVKWGFKSKCGIIATKDQAKLIGWPNQASYMALWLEGEMDENVSPNEEVLTPSFFKLDDLTNKGYKEERDKEIVEEEAKKLLSQFRVSNGSSLTSGGSGGNSVGTAEPLDTVDHGDYTIYKVPADTSNIEGKAYTGAKAVESVGASMSSQSPQYRMQHYKDLKMDPKGFCLWDGRYGVAVGSAVTGTIGQYIDVVLENDTVIQCVVYDQKADRHTDDRWHLFTVRDDASSDVGFRCCSEMTVFLSDFYDKVGRTGDASSAYSNWKSKVKEFHVYKKNFLKDHGMSAGWG